MADTPTVSDAEEHLSEREIRDQKRGYSIDMKYVAIAFLAEGMVIVTSLIGAWLFAEQYGKDTASFYMMMLAPVSYAIIELSRVPLAIAARTQKSTIVRVLACIGVLAAAGVTTKSMAQLGELMFRPRLRDVLNAHHDLKKAEATRDAFQGEYATRKETYEAAKHAFETASESSSKQADDLKTLAKPTTCYATNKKTHKRYSYTCPPTAAAKAVTASVTAHTTVLQDTSAKMDEASKSLRALGSAEKVEGDVVTAKKAYDDAVMNSQLHSFTAMVFGKEPNEVTEAEVYWFLRFFVFLPAVFVSLASTFLAMASVTKIKPKRNPAADVPQGIPLPAGAGHYVLGPYAQEIHRRAVAAAQKAAEDTLKKTAPVTPVTPPPASPPPNNVTPLRS